MARFKWCLKLAANGRRQRQIDEASPSSAGLACVCVCVILFAHLLPLSQLQVSLNDRDQGAASSPVFRFQVDLYPDGCRFQGEQRGERERRHRRVFELEERGEPLRRAEVRRGAASVHWPLKVLAL